MSSLRIPKEDKNWGQVCHIFDSEEGSVSCLQTIAGQCSSIHYHEFRGNQFFVQTGSIGVEEFGPFPASSSPPNLQTSELVLLSPGESYKVNPNIWHRFRVLDPGNLVEIYWPARGPVKLEDIVRYNVGGSDPDGVRSPWAKVHELELGY